MVKATPQKRMAGALFEQLHGQTLDAWLSHQRSKGRSLRSIAESLESMTDGAVDVAPQTILNWIDD